MTNRGCGLRWGVPVKSVAAKGLGLYRIVAKRSMAKRGVAMKWCGCQSGTPEL